MRRTPLLSLLSLSLPCPLICTPPYPFFCPLVCHPSSAPPCEDGRVAQCQHDACVERPSRKENQRGTGNEGERLLHMAVAHGLLRMGGCCVNERTTHLMVVYPFAGVVPMSYMSYICSCVPVPSAFAYLLTSAFRLLLLHLLHSRSTITPSHPITSPSHHHHTTITHTISFGMMMIPIS